MSFGARRDEAGVWRLCERRGRLITRVSSPPDDIDIRFAGRVEAEECADELNDKWWEHYRAKRRLTRGLAIQRGILEVVASHGGITQEDLERAFV